MVTGAGSTLTGALAQDLVVERQAESAVANARTKIATPCVGTAGTRLDIIPAYPTYHRRPAEIAPLSLNGSAFGFEAARSAAALKVK
jgi:hypothetical protein